MPDVSLHADFDFQISVSHCNFQINYRFEIFIDLKSLLPTQIYCKIIYIQKAQNIFDFCVYFLISSLQSI